MEDLIKRQAVLDVIEKLSKVESCSVKVPVWAMTACIQEIPINNNDEKIREFVKNMKPYEVIPATWDTAIEQSKIAILEFMDKIK